MSFLAANPTDFPHLSPCLVERANAGLPTRNDGDEWHPSYGGHARSNSTAITWDFRSQCADDNFALERICRYVSRLMLGHRFGAFPAPGGTRSSASRFHPLQANTRLPGDPNFRAPSGSRFLPKQVCKTRRKTPRKLLSGPSQKADLRPWEPGPLARLRPV